MQHFIILVILGVSMFGSDQELLAAEANADQILKKTKFKVPATKNRPKLDCVGFKNAQGKLHGPLKGFYKGKLEILENYQNGQRHGDTIRYYPNKNKYSKITFRNGKAHGRLTTWYPNNKIMDTFDYKDGIMIGKHVQYYENGKLMLSTPYVNGKAHGRRVHYLPNGAIFGYTYLNKGRIVGNHTVRNITRAQLRAVQKAARRVQESNFIDFWK